MGCPPPLTLKNEPPPPPTTPIWETNPPLKSEAPFQEMIPRKKPQQTVINTCVSIMKQHWKKMAEIPTNVILSLGAI